LFLFSQQSLIFNNVIRVIFTVSVATASIAFNLLAAGWKHRQLAALDQLLTNT